MMSRNLAMASPQLPFGDVNVVILTDVHGWVGGHARQEPYFDADYGDVLSFYQHLKEHCDENEMDLWFVVNGDWAHGTGLSIPGDPFQYFPLLEKMPWDAVNCGNHELYEDAKVEALTRPGGYADWFGDRYLTGNIWVKENEGGDGTSSASSKHLLGHPYKILKGKNSDVLVFGLLYELQNPSQLLEIQKMAEVVKEDWFVRVLTEKQKGKLLFDSILILAHMDVVDPLVTMVLNAIRGLVGDQMPVQFVTGHTHYRGVQQLDDNSNSFEAGKYLDTVGFVSFPTLETIETADQITQAGRNATDFENVFIDTNKEVMAQTLGLEKCETEDGRALSEFIAVTREKLGLNEKVGCAPHDFAMDATLDDDKSLWKLYKEQVVPTTFFPQVDTAEMTSLLFIPKESWRYDIFSREPLIVDDVWAVAPFNDTVVYVGDILGEDLLKLNGTMNEDNMKYLEALPNYIMIGDVSDPKRSYKLYSHDYGAEAVEDALSKINPNYAPFDLTSTTYSSTLLWLTFITESWACKGGIRGKLPDWFGSTDPVTHHTLGDDSSSTNSNNSLDPSLQAQAAVVVVLCALLLLGLGMTLFACKIGLRYIIYGGHRPIFQDEMDPFESGDGNLDVEIHPEKDVVFSTESETDQTTLSAEDHEML